MTLPVIPWIGGKRRLAQHLLPLFPSHECYVEPFCGAAALFFLKEPAKVEVLNDINGDLVTLYRVLQHHLDEFVRQFRWAISSREMFKWAQQTPPVVLTDIQRAARFYYLQKLAFGSKVEGRTFGTATTAPARLNLFFMDPPYWGDRGLRRGLRAGAVRPNGAAAALDEGQGGGDGERHPGHARSLQGAAHA